MTYEVTTSDKDARGRQKSRSAFRTISEVSTELDVPQHVLRFWESKFSHIKPMKRGGNRRYYRPEDVDILKLIRHRLYEDGYTIKGVQKLIKEQGIKGILEGWHAELEGDKGVTPKPVAESFDALKEEVVLNSDSARLQSVIHELKTLRTSLE